MPSTPTVPLAPTIVSFLLPQFHRVAENDQWWGPGFTEWTNAVQARPRFRGHEQPHLPADLGYYDLLVPEVRAQQAELAADHGVSAFCYYHYWFAGRRLLERPFNEVLESGEPDFPFLLCWANEAWTRAWDGASSETLVAQTYSGEDDLEHIRWLSKAFSDRRYLRLDGKPLLLVYRANDLPDPAGTARLWRQEARRLGVGELLLARVESFRTERDDPQAIGFDLSVEFQPDWVNLPRPIRRGRPWKVTRALGLTSPSFAKDRVHDYTDVMARMLAKSEPAWTRIPCVTPQWDNSARRPTGATVLKGSTPDAYGAWLRSAIERSRRLSRPFAGLVFVNAWNEWGEGSHLEPCSRWGRAYIEATRDAIEGVTQADRPGSRSLARRAARAASYRLARAARRSRRRVRDVIRPAAQRTDRARRHRRVTRGTPPPAVLACVYRRDNEQSVLPLVREATALGWPAALWAIDEIAPDLADLTVGSGDGQRVGLLNKLVSILDPSTEAHVVLVDDDVSLVRGTLADLVVLTERGGLALSQPAHSRSSHATYPFTVARPATTARRTDFVEIGPVLCVGPEWRERILPMPAGSGMGWGLEIVWAGLADAGCPIGIVDSVRVRHSSPAASGYDRTDEDARVDALLLAHGRQSISDLHRVRATWWRWQRAPSWGDGSGGHA